MTSMQAAGFFCIADDVLPDGRRTLYCGLCIASAALGICGSMAQIYQWRPLLKSHHFLRRPSPNPQIVIGLAWSDLLACMAVLARAIFMLSTDPPAPNTRLQGFEALKCDSQKAQDGSICEYEPFQGNTYLTIAALTVETLSQYFYAATFMWTLLYALDIYLQLANMKLLKVVYHIMSWTVPLLATLGTLLVLLLPPNDVLHVCPIGTQLALKYFFSYAPLILTLVVDPIIYILCTRLVSKRMRESGLLDIHNQGIKSGLQWKFLSLILIFTICWVPNLVDMGVQIYAISVGLPAATLATFYPIWMLEAVLNPLQGLLNCFVYGRHMLFHRVSEADILITEATPILYNARVYQDTPN